MADSTRDILLKIAATAEFKELRALNAELKESINTVARLRSMLKGDVGGTGLRGAAAGAVEASKAQRKFKEEVEGVNASLTKQAGEIRAAGRLVKTQTTTKITRSGTESFVAETYDPGGGLEKEIRTRGNLVTAIRDTDSARRREGEELKKQKALGRQWNAEIESGATGRVRQLNLERSQQLAARKKELQEQKKLGRQWATEIESGTTGKVRQANLERSQQLEARKKALQEQKKLGRQWAAEIEAQEASRVRQANFERKHEKGIQASTERQQTLERQRAQAIQRTAQFQANEERKNELSKRRQQQKQLVLDQGKETFNKQRAQKGAVVTPVDIYNQKTGQVERMLQLTNKLTGAQFRLNTATGKVTGGFRDLASMQERTGDTLGKIIGKVAIWSVATGAVFGTIRAIRNAITGFAEIEKGMIAVARVTENFGQGMTGIGSGAKVLTSDILDLSVQYGQNAKEAMNAAVIYGRLGMSQREIADAMQYTMATANISGYGMEESAKGIASMVQQFQMGAKDIPGLVDKLSYVDRLSAATMGDLMKAGSRAAGVWHEAGGSVEEFAALIGVVAQRTGRSGAEIGNAFKTMLNRLGMAETQKKLFDMAQVSIRDSKGNFKDPMQILRELRSKTESVTSGVAREIEGKTAGSRQVNFLINALKGLPEIEKQIEAQANAAGAAMQQNMMYMEGMATKADQLAEAWGRFTYALMNSGTGKSMKWWLDSIREILDVLPKDERDKEESARKYRPKADDKYGYFEPFSDRYNDETFQEDRDVKNGERVNELLDLRIKKEKERKLLVEKIYQRPYNEKTDFDTFKPYQQRVDEDNARKRADAFKKLRESTDKQKMVSGLKTPEPTIKSMEYLPTISFEKIQEDSYMVQLQQLEDKLHDIELKSKIEMRITDEFAITPLEATEKKLKIIDAALKKLRSAQGEFPALKDVSVEKEKDGIKRLEDARTTLTEGMPEDDIKQRAKEDMKKMVAARESKEFLAGRIARSPLSGKEETAGLRESLALLAQNRESVKGYKQELMTLSVSTAGREMTSDEKARELNLQKEIHELEMRDAALVGRVDRERVEAMLKVKEAAQQTYETTRKAMGQLSDVDMARARITAGRFKRGELKQFGEEAWNMPAEMRKQFTSTEELFPGMRIMPEMNSTPQDWFTRAERKGPNGERAFQPFAPVYDEATKGLTLSMDIGDAENKIDALGNSLIAYLSTNIGQLWDELIARTDAAARPPKTKQVQGTVR